MGNMDIYNKVRAVPQEAQKAISAGRLKGMTDINPMWRIKVLTELFGPCGIGWYYTIRDKRIDQYGDEGVATMEIELYINVDGKWSNPIPGIGGSKFSTKEKGGVYVSDEVWKMALTDAIIISCKALGVAADIYYAKDRTKYSATEQASQVKRTPQMAELGNRARALGVDPNELAKKAGWTSGQVTQDIMDKMDEMLREMEG